MNTKELIHRCFNAKVSVAQAVIICMCSEEEVRKGYRLLRSYIGAP